MISLETHFTDNNKGFEIIHTDTFDFITTTNPMLTDKAQKLMEVFRNGIPESWPVYHLPFPRAVKSLLIDNEENPQFIVKERVTESTESLEDMTNRDKLSFWQKRWSIVNEFSMAGPVSAALQSQEAQELARRFGFHGIYLIPPLLGWIDKKTQQRWIAYDFVDGHNSLEKETTRDNFFLQHFSDDDQEDFTTELKELYAQKGIDCSNDFGTHQLLMQENSDGQITLFVLDIEHYSRMEATRPI